MRLKVDGVEYTNFISAECEIRLDALANSFAFEAVAPQGQALPFKGGESCEVIVDDEKVLTGFIEFVQVDYDGSDHVIFVQGRDKTADLLDSTIDIIDDLRGEGLTLKFIIEKVIQSLGLSISVIDQAQPDPFNAAEDVASPEPGENAFDFIEKYARKRQVLLTSDANGNVVIATNTGVDASGVVQHIIGADDNNVLRSTFSFDTTGRYNAYKTSSGLNPVALNLAGDTDLASLVNQGGGTSDPEIRKGRQMVIVSESPFSDFNCQERAEWEADVRKARGLLYTAAVPGFRVGNISGALWSINRVYQIVDDFVGKTERMLCNSVVFSFSIQTGRRTTLGFVGRNAYTKVIETDPFAEVANNVA